MSELELWPQDTIRARFAPLRTDDLKPEAQWWVGREATWRAAWVIDEGDYEGDWAMIPDLESNRAAGVNSIGWVPLCDLEPTP